MKKSMILLIPMLLIAAIVASYCLRKNSKTGTQEDSEHSEPTSQLIDSLLPEGILLELSRDSIQITYLHRVFETDSQPDGAYSLFYNIITVCPQESTEIRKMNKLRAIPDGNNRFRIETCPINSVVYKNDDEISRAELGSPKFLFCCYDNDTTCEAARVVQFYQKLRNTRIDRGVAKIELNGESGDKGGSYLNLTLTEDSLIYKKGARYNQSQREYRAKTNAIQWNLLNNTLDLKSFDKMTEAPSQMDCDGWDQTIIIEVNGTLHKKLNAKMEEKGMVSFNDQLSELLNWCDKQIEAEK